MVRTYVRTHNTCTFVVYERSMATSGGLSLPVDDIAKAVSGAVSSVLAKLRNTSQEEEAASDSSSSSIDFQRPVNVERKKGKRSKQLI